VVDALKTSEETISYFDLEISKKQAILIYGTMCLIVLNAIIAITNLSDADYNSAIPRGLALIMLVLHNVFVRTEVISKQRQRIFILTLLTTIILSVCVGTSQLFSNIPQSFYGIEVIIMSFYLIDTKSMYVHEKAVIVLIFFLFYTLHLSIRQFQIWQFFFVVCSEFILLVREIISYIISFK
jgi:hypothetical protein